MARKVLRQLATGPLEAQLLTDLERNGLAVLLLPRHRSLLAAYDDTQLRNLLYQLQGKGWLLPVERGAYVVVPRAARDLWHEHPFVVASAIAPQRENERDYAHYISFWSALSYHDLTEQLPRVVYVATLGRAKRPVQFQGWTYRYVPLVERKFFGYTPVEFPALNGAARIEVPIAEPEKAVLDSLDHERLAGGLPEVIKAVRRGLERRVLAPDCLVEYVDRLGSNAVAARLGYILARFAEWNEDAAAAAKQLLGRVRRSGAPVVLSTVAPRQGAHLVAPWHLLANVPDEYFDEGVL